MKLKYCCKFPNQDLFLDWNGSETAVVYCTACQKITAEIYIDGKYKGRSLDEFNQEKLQ